MGRFGWLGPAATLGQHCPCLTQSRCTAYRRHTKSWRGSQINKIIAADVIYGWSLDHVEVLEDDVGAVLLAAQDLGLLQQPRLGRAEDAVLVTEVLQPHLGLQSLECI